MHEWEWLDRALNIRMLPEPNRRIRWITQVEAERLMAALPGHLAAMVRFSLETGLRRSNVTGLQWSQIDLTRRTAWIHPDQAKARKAIAVPLSLAAMDVIREQIGKGGACDGGEVMDVSDEGGLVAHNYSCWCNQTF